MITPQRNRSLKWAVNQVLNRSLQGWAYAANRGWAKPTRIIFCMTLRCNIRCAQCAIWRLPHNPDELTAAEWQRVILDLRRWIGPYRVQLAGGEIFIRKDILDIIRFASAHDVLTGVVSNGTLIDARLAGEIAQSGLGYIHISLDGIRATTHDGVRGLQGTFEKTMAAIGHLQEAARDTGLAVSIATVINRKNKDELLPLVDFVAERKLNGVLFNPLGPTLDSDPDWYKKTDLWFADPAEVEPVLDQLIARKKAGAPIINPPEQFEEMKAYFARPYLPMNDHCMVGVTNLSITADGEMHTCFKMPSLGNVRRMTPRAAWNSAAARAVRAGIKTCGIQCSPGNFVYRRSLLNEIRRYLRFG